MEDSPQSQARKVQAQRTSVVPTSAHSSLGAAHWPGASEVGPEPSGGDWDLPLDVGVEVGPGDWERREQLWSYHMRTSPSQLSEG